MKQDVRGTVLSLVRLAAEASPANIEEARNAALQACKLIHKHAMLAPITETRPPRAEEDAVDINNIGDLFADLFGNEGHRRRSGARARTPRPPPVPAPPPPQPTVTHQPKRTLDPAAKDIPVHDFGVWCGICGQRILRGRFATWSRGQLYHQQCYKNETE